MRIKKRKCVVVNGGRRCGKGGVGGVFRRKVWWSVECGVVYGGTP